MCRLGGGADRSVARRPRVARRQEPAAPATGGPAASRGSGCSRRSASTRSSGCSDAARQDAARRAHAGWYLDFAERAEPHVLAGPTRSRGSGGVEREHDNVARRSRGPSRRARPASRSGWRPPSPASGTSAATSRRAGSGSRTRSGRHLLPSPGCAPARTGAATLARIQGDYTSARALLEGALGAYRDAGHRKGIGRTLSSLGGIAVTRASSTKLATCTSRVSSSCAGSATSTSWPAPWTTSPTSP